MLSLEGQYAVMLSAVKHLAKIFEWLEKAEILQG